MFLNCSGELELCYSKPTAPVGYRFPLLSKLLKAFFVSCLQLMPGGSKPCISSSLQARSFLIQAKHDNHLIKTATAATTRWKRHNMFCKIKKVFASSLMPYVVHQVTGWSRVEGCLWRPMTFKTHCNRFWPTTKSSIPFLTTRDLNPRPLECQGYCVRPQAYKHIKNQTPLNHLAQAACCLTNWHLVPTKGWGSIKGFDIDPA